MPKVFDWNGYRFHFYSDEGEPVHVHVTHGRDTAKFWLWPDVNVAYNRGFSPHNAATFEQRDPGATQRD